MIIPLRTDRPLRRTPYVNYALIAANLLIFLVQQMDPSLPRRFELSPRDPTTLTFVTYAFLHASWAHIIGNMLFLYIFGNNVNDKMGQAGYLGFYLAGAVFAGIGYVAAPHQVAPIVGASGAIAAVIGAYLVLFPRSHITILYFFFLIGLYEIASLWFILLWFAYDVFLNFSQSDNVAHVAHIGGTLFGFVICFLLLLVNLLPRDQFDIVAILQRWNRRRQYRDVVATGYDPFDYSQSQRSAQRPPPPDPRAMQISSLRAAISDAVAAHETARAAALYVELKTLDPQQVLPRQAQLDVANKLAEQQQYAQAAEAYEAFLAAYPKAEQAEQLVLLLGLMYGRYLGQPQRAREYLNRAINRLHGDSALAMAREELARLAQAP